MSDWIKQIQSVGRGFRPGMEINVISSGRQVGKTLILDYESDEFKPWRETFRPHWAEYRDELTGDTYWKKSNKMPAMRFLYRADRIIRLDEDGTYRYVKNRYTGELNEVPKEEMAWIILAAK